MVNINDFTQDRQTPEWVSNTAKATDQQIAGMNSASKWAQTASDDINKQASDWGIPKGFLSTNNSNRTLSSAAERLLENLNRAAQRTYTGSGFADSNLTRPNSRGIITQTPEAIILIKKRIFSSLSDNFKQEFLDDSEYHFIKAAKNLFKIKCEQIASYERLTKLNKILIDNGVITTPIASAIYDAVNALEGTIFNDEGGGFLSGILSKKIQIDDTGKKESLSDYLTGSKDAIKKIRAVLELNGFSQTTNWVTEPISHEGSGVIELTLVNTFSVTNSVELGGGNGSFSVIDPYHMFFITELDIEKALVSTSSTDYTIIDYTADTLEADTEELKQELNDTRSSRGASILTYHINATTRVYNSIIIMLESVGYEVTKSDGSGLNYEGLVGNPRISSVEEFTKDEKRLLNKIYKNMGTVQQIRMKNYVQYKNFNKFINYTRKMMRENFLGQNIIQPMDSVTIFVDSQTIEDKLIMNGMSESFKDMTSPINFGNAVTKGISNTFGSTNFVGLLNNTVGKMKAMGGSEKIPADTAIKNMLVGKNFPYWLWDKLRPNFTSGTFGTCVFVGIVKSVSEDYSDGSYSLKVGLGDNSSYFQQGFINTKPGVFQYNGDLYDPLTPFDFEFDASNGQTPDCSNYKLLPENRKILEAGLLTMPDGKNAGEAATLQTFGNIDVEPKKAISNMAQTFSNISNRIYTVPDGFVYRWKKGIGSAIMSQSGTPDGDMSARLGQNDVALVAQQDPFGGQDFINAASILICGEPYNFNTFFQAAKAFGTISLTSEGNQSTDYFQGIFKRIKDQNKLWGDFIPFKKLTIDPKTFGVSIAIQMNAAAHSSQVSQKQQQKTKLIEKLMQYEGDIGGFDITQFQAPIGGANNGAQGLIIAHPAITVPIIKQILELDAEIQIHTEQMAQSFQQNQNNNGGTITAIGDSILYDSSGDVKTSGDITERNKVTLQEQNEIIKRRLWQVKANQDKNLFVVGSEFDNDYDIQAVSQSLNKSFDFINTNWQQILEKLKSVVNDAMGMEIFANSQGHIELRTPKYNKMPSSIFFEMLRRKKEYNIQVYPNFLEKMFKNQIEAVFADIETVEDQIRLRCIALGAKAGDDLELEELLAGSKRINGGIFKFVTEQNGKLVSIREAMSQISSYYTSSPEDFGLGPFTLGSMSKEFQDFFARNTNEAILNFQAQSQNTTSQFDISKRIDNYNNIVKKFAANINLIAQQEEAALVIRTRLKDKLGVNLNSVPTVQQLMSGSKNGKLSPSDINRVQNDIQGLVVRRYESIQIAGSLIKNLDSAARINSPDSDILGKLMLPNLYSKENVPEFLYDMIEDEDYDDFGRDSGKRFVIREKDIISMTYSQEDPSFTAIEISGSEMGGLVGDQGFNTGNGLQMCHAFAVDYDLWRMYGFKQIQQKNLPFLSNPELQLAPYATYLLNKERSKISKATVTARGNEYMQPGEVYYIQERGMLFYSESVTHSFTYGSSFQTTLILDYGHAPGIYIPSPLDIIGRNIFKGEHFNIGDYRIARTGTTVKDIGTPLGAVAIQYTFSGKRDNAHDMLYGNQPYGEINKKTMDDIIGKLYYLTQKTLPATNSTMEAVVVRIYSDCSVLKDAAQEIINEIKKIIPINKIVGGISKDPSSYKYGIPMVENMPLGIKNRNPSNNAWFASRDLMKLNNRGNNIGDNIMQYIATRIIDIWIETSVETNEQLINGSTKAFGSTSTLNGNSNTTNPTVLSNMLTNYNALKKANILNPNNDFIIIGVSDTKVRNGK